MAAFQRVYVANRGEIACRVISALRQRGTESVLGVSEADVETAAADLADQVTVLGPPPAGESYLAIEKVVAAALAAGCDAVHPGYGFLAERSDFARAVAEAGMTFIGPTPETMDLLGDKVRAREVAGAAQVPLVPGTPEAVTPELAIEAGAGLGFPLLVKAAAGGGGRGMRKVDEAGQLEEAVRAASREAEAAFGDGTVFLERYLERPRHVEVQILGDGAGKVLHLFERECSVQRRHQKVIEEAPAPLTPSLRERVTGAAVRLGEAVSYAGAGTVEFLVAGDEFFFLEVNTRIQVEHPVTEAVVGIDLVAAQLDVAEGRGLPLEQADLRLRGHSIEARLYAEDPAQGYLPSPGKLLALEFPRLPGLRVDAGVREGDRVTEHYDSMIAKLVTVGADREEARRRLVAALRQTVVLGVVTNQAHLLSILEHPEFVAHGADIHCLERWLPDWSPPRTRLREALAAATLAAARTSAGATSPSQRGGGIPSPWQTLAGVKL